MNTNVRPGLGDVIQKLTAASAEVSSLSRHANVLQEENVRLRRCLEALCVGQELSIVQEEIGVRAAIHWAERSAYENLLTTHAILRVVSYATRDTLQKVCGSAQEYLVSSTANTMEQILETLRALQGKEIDAAAAVAAAPYYSDPLMESLVAELQEQVRMTSPRRTGGPAIGPTGPITNPTLPPLVTVTTREHNGQRGYLLGVLESGKNVVQLLGSKEIVHVLSKNVKLESHQYSVMPPQVLTPPAAAPHASVSRDRGGLDSPTSSKSAGTSKRLSQSTPGTTPRTAKCKAGDYAEIVDVLHPNYGANGPLRPGATPVDWYIETATGVVGAHVTQMRIAPQLSSPPTPRESRTGRDPPSRHSYTGR